MVTSLPATHRASSKAQVRRATRPRQSRPWLRSPWPPHRSAGPDGHHGSRARARLNPDAFEHLICPACSQLICPTRLFGSSPVQPHFKKYFHFPLTRALERALARNVKPAVYTEDMFKTTHEAAHRDAVKAAAPNSIWSASPCAPSAR
jgi:hypothetical protein